MGKKCWTSCVKPEQTTDAGAFIHELGTRHPDANRSARVPASLRGVEELPHIECVGRRHYRLHDVAIVGVTIASCTRVDDRKRGLPVLAEQLNDRMERIARRGADHDTELATTRTHNRANRKERDGIDER